MNDQQLDLAIIGGASAGYATAPPAAPLGLSVALADEASWETRAFTPDEFRRAHPTQNEAIGEAFLALAGTPRHAHA